jgi:transposase
LFADTVGGTNARANLYSLIETAKANNVEPYRYLVALSQKLPLAQTVDDYEVLLPWNIDLGTKYTDLRKAVPAPRARA